MEIKHFENGYEIVNRYQQGRYGFSHVSTLLHNGHQLREARVHYVNRTWERYTYESSMKNVVDLEIKYLEQLEIDGYKKANDIKRLTKEARAKALENLKGYSSRYNSLLTLYKQL